MTGRNGKRLAGGVAVSALTTATLTAGLLFAATPASASGGGVRASGACTMGSTWEMKAKHDDGRIELELEVDTPRIGRTWSVVITDNGTRVFKGTRVTKAPSGSFTVERLVRNHAGTDHFWAKARSLATGATCVARVNL
jgi:hypothetical protein